MKGALVADTGGLLKALADDGSGRPSFPAFKDALVSASRVIVPALVLAEVDYFLRNERRAMRAFVADVLDPSSTYELEQVEPGDVVRALELDARFVNLNLGLVDGMVVAVAERLRIQHVLTTDRRHFSAVRIGSRLDRALTIVP